MTLLSQHYLVITALGTDCSGVVNTITRHVNSCGYNIKDSRLVMLREEFTSTMLLSGSWNAVILIESTLPSEGTEPDLLVVTKCTTARPCPSVLASVWIQVNVADSPHLVERLAALFDAHHTNAAELVSRTQPVKNERAAQLRTQIAAHSLASTDVVDIEQMFKALCTRLNVQGSINVVDYSQHDRQDGVK